MIRGKYRRVWRHLHIDRKCWEIVFPGESQNRKIFFSWIHLEVFQKDRFGSLQRYVNKKQSFSRKNRQQVFWKKKKCNQRKAISFRNSVEQHPVIFFGSNRWRQISLGLLSEGLRQGSNHSAMVSWKNINTVECGSSGEGRLRKQGPKDNRKDRSERLPSVKQFHGLL